MSDDLVTLALKCIMCFWQGFKCYFEHPMQSYDLFTFNLTNIWDTYFSKLQRNISPNISLYNSLGKTIEWLIVSMSMFCCISQVKKSWFSRKMGGERHIKSYAHIILIFLFAQEAAVRRLGRFVWCRSETKFR